MNSRETPSFTGMDTRVFISLVLLIIVLLTQTIHQTLQIRRQQEILDTSFAQQRDIVDQAQKLRAQLEAIAGDTAVLAEQGNANAVKLRDYLQQQGVTIRPR